ncbi:DUF2274 domain-containing protein [Brevundimonas sp. SORGH_AS_0993]|uniref:DUF2274 domain-containing protein n=1 Tax=Brevundimonas sp. SORGH_AS_0993 TaxID=3041794 RepID=UPI0027884247|nr:DUF2274 domain-containing protein [Brevundimonas sp. SORGH_AS_0993]MDQ1153461.1 hypothetical protein [Brevundimonas sp. SORGH_AS_0993]
MLKLAKLPDRTPVKITITVMPDLNRALSDYAAVYKEAYGEKAEVADLIPFMLDAFLAADREFAKARKDRGA